MSLQDAAGNVLDHLVKVGIYDPFGIKYTVDEGKKSISFQENVGKDLESLDGLCDSLQTAQFKGLGRSAKRAWIAGRFKMAYNRALGEVAKKSPSPVMKNVIYRHTGVQISKPEEVIIAPNALIEYIYPELVTIKPGAFIGEDAKILGHAFDVDRFIIGNVYIGEDCVVGASAIVYPGTTLHSGVRVGGNATVKGEHPAGKKIEPSSYARSV